MNDDSVEYYKENWYDKPYRWITDHLREIKYRIFGYPDSNLIQHAKRELVAAGYDLNEKEEGPNKWIVENLLELLQVFSRQGHSGFSAPYCVNMFNKLARYEPLVPIMCTDDEWNDVSEIHDSPCFQNNRCGAIFKKGVDSDPYYLDAIVWVDQTGCAFTGTVEEVTSRQKINIPFVPKTFYIDVIHNPETDDYEIKNLTDLESVFEYYKRN